MLSKEPELVLAHVNDSLTTIMAAVRADIMLHFLVTTLLAGDNIG